MTLPTYCINIYILWSGEIGSILQFGCIFTQLQCHSKEYDLIHGLVMHSHNSATMVKPAKAMVKFYRPRKSHGFVPQYGRY